MKKFALLAFGLLIGVAASAQTVTVVSWADLDAYLSKDSKKVRVVNFWATWCGPCVKELPYFQQAHEKYGDDVEIVLVSLDDVDILDQRVIPFVGRKGLTTQVWLLNEIDYNMFIPKVDERWSGAIPMTLIIDDNSSERKFLERELSQDELNALITEYID